MSRSPLSPPQVVHLRSFLAKRWAPLTLALACVLAYLNSLDGQFVWVDEAELVEGGYRVVEPRDLARVWTLSLDQYLHRNLGQSPSQGGYWRPIYALLISLDWWLFREEPFGYHAINILWHLAVVCGLYALARRVYAFLPQSQGVAFAAALLFAVHPLGTHSVSWISGRKDAASAAFAVISLLALARAVHRPYETVDTGRCWLWPLVSLVCLFLAIGCKELAVVTPVVGMVFVCYDWDRGYPRNFGGKAGLLTVAAMFGLVAAVMLYRQTVLGGIGLNVSYPAANLLGNVAMMARLFWHYVWLILWPRRPLISDAWPIIESPAAADFAAMAGLVLLAVGLLWGTSRRWVFVPGLLWFVVWLAPAAGLVPLRHVRAERYLYPASWGLLLAACVAASQIPLWQESAFARRLGKLSLAALVLYALGMTIWSNYYWHDDATLFADAVARDSEYREGRVALARHALDGQEYDEAIRQTKLVLASAERADHTGYWSPWVALTNLGLAHQHRGKAALDSAIREADRIAADKYVVIADIELRTAIRAFEEALASQPRNALAHYHVGSAALAARDFKLAEHYLRAAIDIMPDHVQSRGDLGYLYLHAGQADLAIEMLTPLVHEFPDNAQNRVNLASAHLVLKQFDLALPHFQHLVATEPTNVINRAKLAWCQWEEGQDAIAIGNITQALRQAPTNPVVRSIGTMMRQR